MVGLLFRSCLFTVNVGLYKFTVSNAETVEEKDVSQLVRMTPPSIKLLQSKLTTVIVFGTLTTHYRGFRIPCGTPQLTVRSFNVKLE